MKKTVKIFLLAFTAALIAIPAFSESREAPELTPTSMMTAEARLLVSMLEQAHFSGRSLNDLEIEKLVPNFMSDLDHHRLFFKQGDFEEFQEAYDPESIQTHLRRGDLEPAFAIYTRYRERALDRIDWILARLDEDFDVDSDSTFIPDRRKAEWPANKEEADKLWEQRLTYELLADLLNDEPMETAKENVSRRYDRLQRSILEVDSEEVQEVFLTAFSKLYDPHSSFLAARTLEDFSISMRLSLVGIGAMLRSEDGYCTIQELVPGGPASIDGQLRPNDRIVGVAQDGEEPVDVIDMSLRRVVEMIRGEKGTTVHLTIIPADAADSSARETITLVRDEIRLTASRASAKIHEVPTDEKTVPVGVISVPSFYGDVGPGQNGEGETSTTDDVAELIEKLEEAGVEAIVLDLRRNGGGLLTEAIRMTGLFIDGGPVVRVKSSDGTVRVDPDRNPDIAYHGPLAVLVARNSASASEIVAGALQNYGRALVLGESSTHGKGTVQAIFELDNYLMRMGGPSGKAGAAKLTVQKFYLPDGGSTQSRGVIPDIVFPSFNDHLPIGEGDLTNALEWDKINVPNWSESLEHYTIPWSIAPEKVDQLAERTEERQEDLEEFGYLREYINWFQERQEQKAVSLNLEHRRESRKKDEAFRDQMREIEERLAANDFSSVEFVLDEHEEANSHQPNEADPEDEELEESIMRRGGEGNLDVHLRESLRIVSDLILKEQDKDEDSKRAVTAQKSSS